MFQTGIQFEVGPSESSDQLLHETDTPQAPVLASDSYMLGPLFGRARWGVNTPDKDNMIDRLKAGAVVTMATPQGFVLTNSQNVELDPKRNVAARAST